MNGVIGLLGTLALLLAAGGAIGLIDRRGFRPGWLLVAAAEFGPGVEASRGS